MQVAYAELKERSLAVTAAIAEARSARNLQTRHERAARTDELEAERARRRRRRKEKEELLAQLSRRVRIRVPEEHRPRIGQTTARKLIQRVSGLLPGPAGLSDARGPDGLYSIHFDFTPRGFGSTKGRRWRPGEAERAARYVTREGGLEDGERGWWSNIAEDRGELVGFFRTLEALEKHDRSNANVYVSEIIALPAELTTRQRRKAVRRICDFFKQRGLGYLAALHLPDEAGDQRNFHCHILYSLRPCERVRPFEWSFAVAKEADINTPAGIGARRRQVVRDINATLHAAHVNKRYTHLSNKARGTAAPEPNAGQVGTWIARRLAAMEARAALLQRVRSLAGEVRSALIENSARLSRLGTQVERRHAEATRQRAIVRAAVSKSSKHSARLLALKRVVQQRLAARRDGVGAGSTDARVAVASHAPQVARRLAAQQSSVRGASEATARRSGSLARRRELRDRLDTIGLMRTAAPLRAEEIATGLYARLQSFRSAVRLGETGAEAEATRMQDDALNRMQAWRRQLGATVVASGLRLGRAAERAQAIAVLQEKLAVVESRKAERDLRSALYLPVWRHVALARLKAMTGTIAAQDSASRLAALSSSLAERLFVVRASVALRADRAERRFTDTRKQVRQEFARGIGQGPQRREIPPGDDQPQLPRSEPALPAKTRANAASPSAVPRAAPRKESEMFAELRRVVRAHKPDPTTELYPPPRERVPAPTIALLLDAEQWEKMRAEARLRRKKVLEEARAQALARLKRLDIEVIINGQGLYDVAKDGLWDVELRALMDPALHDRTQAFLARIAYRRSRLPTLDLPAPSSVPEMAPRPLPDPAIELATLAAAAAAWKARGRGD